MPEQSNSEKKHPSSPTYRLSNRVVLESFDDGALVLHLDTLNLTELNETARDILQMTNGRNTLERVARKLSLQYDIPLPQSQGDVHELYQDLTRQGILEKVDKSQKDG